MELVTNDYEFISFDNEQTFTIKAAYASEQCMGGYMWWAVDMVGESFGIEVGSPTTSPVPTSVFSPSDSPTRALNPPTNDPSCPSGYTGLKVNITSDIFSQVYCSK